MSTSTTAPAPSRKRKRGPYSYSKCKDCRKDKKKCEPIERPADQPCHRCQEKGLQCSPHEDIRKSDITTAPSLSNNNSVLTPDFRQNDTTPAPSLSDSNSVTTPDLKDPVIQCLHLFNWYRIVPRGFPIKKDFRQAVINIFTFTWKNSTNSDFKGKALLAYLTRQINAPRAAFDNNVRHVTSGLVEQSGSYHTTRLEYSRSIWDAGDTMSSIETLRDLLHAGWSKGPYEDPGEVLTLQIVRQYFGFLKHFWDINRQLLNVYHAQLASLAPKLQSYIEIHFLHFDLYEMPSNVFDRILDEEPAYCTSLDVYGETLLHVAAKGFNVLSSSNLLQKAQELLDRGIDINKKNYKGETALHCLCDAWRLQSSQIPLLKLMIQHKEIDINAQNEEGETALHVLCGRCSQYEASVNMLQLLLEHQDTDVGIRDKRGRVPADCLPQATTANLFEEHPFLRRLFPSTPLVSRSVGWI